LHESLPGLTRVKKRAADPKVGGPRYSFAPDANRRWRGMRAGGERNWLEAGDFEVTMRAGTKALDEATNGNE
jgi:hypothetical protein